MNSSPKNGAKINDIVFVRALLGDMAKRTSVDKNRIYATGNSNGAGMTFKIGAELSSFFAAIALWAPDCNPLQRSSKSVFKPVRVKTS